MLLQKTNTRPSMRICRLLMIIKREYSNTRGLADRGYIHSRHACMHAAIRYAIPCVLISFNFNKI